MNNKGYAISSVLRLFAPYVSAVVIMLLAACQGQNNRIENLRNMAPAADMAQLILYYPDKIIGADGKVQVDIQGQRSCKLQSGSYMVRDVTPNKQTIGISFCGLSGVSYVSMVPIIGKKYYIRILPYDSSLTGIASGYPTEYVPPKAPGHKGPFKVERVEEAQALSDLRNMTLSKD